MDYHRLICFDKLLPAGRLRESAANKRRADIVVVTKCPLTITPMEQRGIERSLALFPWQILYFTYFKYGSLYPLFDKTKENLPLDSLRGGNKKALLLTGIASPEQLEYDINKYVDFESMHFCDHHSFTSEDLRKIEGAFNDLHGNDKMIITTEKDAAHLVDCDINEDVAKHIYVLPIEVEFMNGKADDFNKTIMDYVRRNSRNCSVLKRKNDRKA
jgi:tetraacyldisaccharide 4'-kinase